MERAGGRCEHCGSTEDLRACHIVPLHKGGCYALSNGMLLCVVCDTATGKFARRTSAKRP
jgi:5-methylcytosine-specific restriction endonuclease McrA